MSIRCIIDVGVLPDVDISEPDVITFSTADIRCDSLMHSIMQRYDIKYLDFTTDFTLIDKNTGKEYLRDQIISNGSTVTIVRHAKSRCPPRKKLRRDDGRSVNQISPSTSTNLNDSDISDVSNVSDVRKESTEIETAALRDWSDKFSSWDPDTRSAALDLLISSQTLDFEGLRQLRDCIDKRLRFDIVRNVPYEIALYIMSFLQPRDLCLAAQTCRYYRIVCEDNRIWREKCREDGLLNHEETFNDLFKKRIHRTLNNKRHNITSESNFQRSEHKAAYLRQMSIVRNWRNRNFDMNQTNDGRISPPPTSSSSSGTPGQNESSSGASPSPSSLAADARNADPQSPSSSIEFKRVSAPTNSMRQSHLMRLRCHEEHVITCLQYNPLSDLIVSGSDDFTLKVWSASTGKCSRTLRGHAGGVWSSQLSPDNTIISGSTDRTIRVWDAITGESKYTFYGHTSTVRCLALNGNLVVSGSRDTTLRLWSIKSFECIHLFNGHAAAVRCVEYKEDMIVSGAYDNLVKVWNAKTGSCIHSLEAHENRIYSLQFDGTIIASGSLDTSICIWSAKTGMLKHKLTGHTSLTSKMQLKSNILVSANADSYCKIWDISTGKCLRTLEGANKHVSAITSVYFNSRFVVTSSDDGTVKLWDLKSGEFIRNLIVLPTAGKGGVVWRIRASNTKLVCAVGSRTADTEDTHLLVLDFDDDLYDR